jgi:hypothetical protein
VAAGIFWQAATGHALIRLVVLGVPTWIVCNTRSAFVRLSLWLSQLTALNRCDTAHDFQEDIKDFREESADVFGDWFSAQPPVPRFRKPGQPITSATAAACFEARVHQPSREDANQ